MLGPLTYLDAALIGIAILSGLLAMYRGLTREVLSIVSWIAAVRRSGGCRLMLSMWGLICDGRWRGNQAGSRRG